MVLYTKTVESDSMKKAYAIYYECKAAQDIINNVMSGNIEVKKKETYDALYVAYIKNLIAYDKESQKIEEDLLGKGIIIPNAITFISPVRGKFIVQLTSTTDKTHAENIDQFLIKRGFDRLDIE